MYIFNIGYINKPKIFLNLMPGRISQETNDLIRKLSDEGVERKAIAIRTGVSYEHVCRVINNRLRNNPRFKIRKSPDSGLNSSVYDFKPERPFDASRYYNGTSDISDYLLRRIKEMGITKGDLAEKAGVSLSSVWSMIRHSPSSTDKPSYTKGDVLAVYKIIGSPQENNSSALEKTINE